MPEFLRKLFSSGSHSEPQSRAQSPQPRIRKRDRIKRFLSSKASPGVEEQSQPSSGLGHVHATGSAGLTLEAQPMDPEASVLSLPLSPSHEVPASTSLPVKLPPTSPAIGSAHVPQGSERAAPDVSVLSIALPPSPEVPKSVSLPVTSPPALPTIPAPSSTPRAAFNFTLTLLKKIPDIVDVGNPAKMVLGIAKAIIEIKEAVQGNLDEVESRIVSTAAQVLIVEKALVRWPEGGQQNPAMLEFERKLTYELEKLGQLQRASLAREIAEHEDRKDEIARIFDNVNEARMQFELDTNIRLYEMVYAIDMKLKRELRTQLQVSDAADYKYAGEGHEKLHRVPCTPGTRISTLDTITGWANGNGNENIFWLFGPAGSGKSTIAYTIARRFEATTGVDDTITLGGNFFCSRQIKEARHESQIVRTLVYHLSLKCRAFADALNRLGDFDTIKQGVEAQLQGLLIRPWEEVCRVGRGQGLPTANYFFLIDAVDELAGDGGPAFLRTFLDTLNKYDLHGLKFFITSRSDPQLVKHVESYERKELCRLQDVAHEQVQADIKLYLEESFPHFRGREEMKILLKFAGVLFICAATLTRYLRPDLEKHSEDEESMILRNLSDSQATESLDTLYETILKEAFKNCDGTILDIRLRILRTFLCTAERTSAATAGGLLLLKSSTRKTPSAPPTIPDAVLASLHAVLYADAQGNILWYHKSFSDFIFDQNRCPKEFWCSIEDHHHHLAQSCFCVMHDPSSGLRFNIANISSSFMMDSDNPALQGAVSQNVSLALRYSSRNWSYHLNLASGSSKDSQGLEEELADFIGLQALFWMEAMNLLGCRGQCQGILQEASKWIHHIMGNEDLARMATEVASFAQHFSGSPAAHSTPHLYISALTTWPQASEPFMSWRQHFGRMPTFVDGRVASALMHIRVGSPVWGAALSPDGTRIASGSEDGLVRIWNTMTGEEQMALWGHTALVDSVAFSRDGGRIVSGSNDKSMHIWDVETGEELRVLHGHTRPVKSVSFSSDGRRIVSGSNDRSIRIWDAKTGEQQMVLLGHTDWIGSVAISSDGGRIVSGSKDNSIRIWDAKTGKQQTVLQEHAGSVRSVAFSSDGGRIVSGSNDKSVRVWDVETGEELRVLQGHSDLVLSVAFSSNGRQIVSSSGDNSLRIWDAETGEERRVLLGHTGPVMSVAFTSDGGRIVSGSEDKSICVWEVETHEEQRVLKGHTSQVLSVAFSKNGRQIVSGLMDNSIRVWDAKTGEEQC